MRSLPALILALAALALLTPAARAKPQICTIGAVNQLLVADGKLTRADIDADAAVDLVRCGDVTGDGVTDGLFTVASGGTAGDTRFGVYRGGARPKLVLWEQGYKVGVARASSRAFDVLQPHYKDGEPNCCPSSFRVRRYTWNGRHFHAGKVKKLKKVPPRFFQ